MQTPRTRRALIAGFALLLGGMLASSCTPDQIVAYRSFLNAVPPSSVDYTETAAVSWYNPASLGGRCASGPCPPNSSYSCAHKSAPFGTVLKLTAPNGRSVSCRVVDRGPYVRGRAVDLFPAPAAELGITEAGVARNVTIQRVVK